MSSQSASPGSAATSVPALALRHVSISVPGRVLVHSSDLTIASGEVVGLLGPSGSGKTTLLNVAAGVAPATSGQVIVAGEDLSHAKKAARARYRLRRIGLVFQFSELLPELTAGENVALPLLLSGHAKAAALRAARVALKRVGLDGYSDRWPEALSGGEAQRAAVARAVVAMPALILADEPTGALDEDNSRAIGELFREIAHESGCGVLVGTHDPVVASLADRTVRIVRSELVAA